MNKVFLATFTTLLQFVHSQQCGTIGHTNTDATFDRSGGNAFYINRANPATCEGVIISISFCYRRPDDQADEYTAIFALYKQQSANDIKYNIVSTPVVLRKSFQQVGQDFGGDNIVERFVCTRAPLNPPLAVSYGDVFGVCVDNLDLVDPDGDVTTPIPSECSNTLLPNDITVAGLSTDVNGAVHLYADIVQLDTNSGGIVAPVVIFILLIVVVSTAAILTLCIKKRFPDSKSHQASVQMSVVAGKQTNKVVEEGTDSNQRLVLPKSQPQEHEYEFSDGFRTSLFQCEYISADDDSFAESSLNSEPESPTGGPSLAYMRHIEKNKEWDIYESELPFELPADKEDEIYKQFKAWEVTIIPHEQLRIVKHLGSGQFGSVDRGVWRRDGARPKGVALKSLTKTSAEDKVKFLQEAAIMAQFKHPCVLKLHGIITENKSVVLVMDLAEKGDLLEFLLPLRPSRGHILPSFTDELFLQFSQQVALGMQYLSAKGFIHRDLAARNILVTRNNFCKVADFGLTRDLADEKYYISQGKDKIPVKWTAPEAIYYRKYSTASDVWSYGCLLYEIWSLGHKLYEDINNFETIRRIDTGKRLPPPPGCPKVIYELMVICWHPETSKRPSFRDIVLTLSGSEEIVLNIPKEDLSTDPLAEVLGAPLKSGEKMYSELQRRYTTNPNS